MKNFVSKITLLLIFPFVCSCVTPVKYKEPNTGSIAQLKLTTERYIGKARVTLYKDNENCSGSLTTEGTTDKKSLNLKIAAGSPLAFSVKLGSGPGFSCRAYATFIPKESNRYEAVVNAIPDNCAKGSGSCCSLLLYNITNGKKVMKYIKESKVNDYETYISKCR